MNEVVISRKIGRLEVCLRAIPLGEDLLVLMTGGAEHIGAVTIASGEEEPVTTRFATHKEYHVTELAAKVLCDFAGKLTAIGGIHFDDITKDEIDTVMELVNEALTELRTRLIN